MAKICHRPLWTNRLVNMVHGCCRKAAGSNPRRKISSRETRVAIKIIRFRIIRNHIGVSLKPW